MMRHVVELVTGGDAMVVVAKEILRCASLVIQLLERNFVMVDGHCRIRIHGECV
jgi:prepilin-type processing-associated H-X9-DG protein